MVRRELLEGDALLIGAGDIVRCDKDLPPAQATAKLIDRFPGATVFTLGDNVYQNGTKKEFDDCYDKAWGGSIKERTRPSPGNHDYGIYPPASRFNADPYFNYFGAKAGSKGLGYYSYDVGQWHVISLNSMAGEKGAPKMADQRTWLERDLAANPRKCTLAYWHHPLFSSGSEHGDQATDPGRKMGVLWKPLLDHGADVILNGHDHHYERFDRQDANKMVTAAGIREFIVGTGGGDQRGLSTTKDNSQVSIPDIYGVLLLTLHPTSYEWHFIDTDGNVRDSGSEDCH
ncbi:MAG TPA: metallophosphoesterase [Thermoanaerobaculia bacterium]|nr:metallophosphoesterase [Thermoanaerobaculia bacterium]